MIVLASEEWMDEEGARGCGRLFSLLPDSSIPLYILLQACIDRTEE
jgi:hypothetical protein